MIRSQRKRWVRTAMNPPRGRNLRKRHPVINRKQHGLAGSLSTRVDSSERPQAKLRIGAKNDKYEQEADRVADRVLGMPDSAAQKAAVKGSLAASAVQRFCPECEPAIQRQPMEEEEEMLQMQPLEEEAEEQALQRQTLEEEEEETILAKKIAGASLEKTNGLNSLVYSLQGKGQPLPESERAYFEPRFGADLNHIRVHTDNAASNAAQQAQARAFTYGKDIVFGSGEYAPGSQHGRRLLAHEITHTFQQGAKTGKNAQPAFSHSPSGKMIQGDFWSSLGRGWDMYWEMDDEGAPYARQLMEWRLTGLGMDFERYDPGWSQFMCNRPEIQRAMAHKFEQLAQRLAAGGAGSGTFSTSITGVRLNELESMRLTLHGCHRIDIEGDYEVTEDGGDKVVRLTGVHFTWVDRADLHPGTGTVLESGETVDDREFTSAGWDYDIRIHFYMPLSSTWRATSSGVRHERGWPPVTGAPAAGFRG